MINLVQIRSYYDLLSVLNYAVNRITTQLNIFGSAIQNDKNLEVCKVSRTKIDRPEPQYGVTCFTFYYGFGAVIYFNAHVWEQFMVRHILFCFTFCTRGCKSHWLNYVNLCILMHFFFSFIFYDYYIYCMTKSVYNSHIVNFFLFTKFELQNLREQVLNHLNQQILVFDLLFKCMYGWKLNAQFMVRHKL